MVKSLFVTASAGSGKTFRLTKEVRRHLEDDTVFVVAVTFTRAAAAEMEKRILEEIEERTESATEKLRLIMRAAKVHFSTIDSLFHQFLATEQYMPQIADDHEREIIAAITNERFFQHPSILADLEIILIAARILNLPPERLIDALDKNKDALASWECPDGLLADLKEKQARLVAEYETLREQVQSIAEETKGVLRSQVVDALIKPISGMDLGKALFLKSDLAEVTVAAPDRVTPAYAVLLKLYPPMRRLIAEHLINTKRLRSSLLKRFSMLRASVLAKEKERLNLLYFDDIPRALVSLDGPDSPDRPVFTARLYELGFHRTSHMLLDEFQDTSQIQLDLFRPILDEILSCVGENAEGERSLFLVGDWKQSIYQWRGAAPDLLKACLASPIRTGQIATESLPHNYRSTPLLIAFFNHLVKQLFAGTDKIHLQTPPPKPEYPYNGISEVKIIPISCSGGDEPAYERLVQSIMKKKEDCGCAWGDMVVLCRTNGHMDKVAATLAQVGILTSGIRGRELLSLREGTALYLSLIAIFDTHDGRFIFRALSMLEYSEALAATLVRLAGNVSKAPRPHRFATFAAVIRELLPYFPRVIIERMWDEAERYFYRPDTDDAAAFLRYLLKMSRFITVPEGQHTDRIKLATIHSTKGLEFPHVFLFWKEGHDRAPAIRRPDDGCPLDLNKGELDFLATGPIAGAAAIAEAAETLKEEKAEETANLLYVAATRAVKSLTIILRADKEGALKGFSEKMYLTAEETVPDADRTDFGWRHDYGPDIPRHDEHEVLTAPDLSDSFVMTTNTGEMDPALSSAAIEAGIERGIRIHAALARLTGDNRTIARSNLTEEEFAAIDRFLHENKIREIIFRPGAVLTEQHISDTSLFGIVDRLIIAPDHITLIDLKTGRIGHLADKYRRQMIRYRTILQGLFCGRRVDGYLLFVDEPHRILMI